MTATTNCLNTPIPVLLLKNPSAGHEDPYTIHLSSNPQSHTFRYQPIYVPVLEHTLYTEPILTSLDLVLGARGTECAIHASPYGGFIFTSQRAVEAFEAGLSRFLSSAGVNDHGSSIHEQLKQLAIPLYAVGPATALSLDAIVQKYLTGCWIRGGGDAGSGEILADLILNDYNNAFQSAQINGSANQGDYQNKAPLLFFTGAKHRDIIPTTLASAPPDRRIAVEELVVYASTESHSFASDVSSTLQESTTATQTRWIVIFSPMAGETFLRALGWLDEETAKVHGPDHPCWRNRKTYVASIGPTTRDYMKKRFRFEVDVCAAKPSPEGVREGIEEFMLSNGLVP
ncbi:MAG: hypothetical protein Q9219_005032 [cf. Caloplaca sp. 3 TL-2023]